MNQIRQRVILDIRLIQERIKTSERNQQNKEIYDQLWNKALHQNKQIEKSQQSLLSKIQKNRISLDYKAEIQSMNESDKENSNSSQQMDIDEQNDIVNQLSYLKNLKNDDQQDQQLTNFSIKDRILHANSKKHQGNQFFKQHNLEQAISSYKIALSLLKPQSFALACESDCLLMAQLTSNILYNMGTCYFILMSFKQAIKYYDQAILIKPNYIKAIHNRALCHFQEGNISKSYEDIKIASKMDKENMTIKTDLKKIEDQYIKIYPFDKVREQKFIYDPDKKVNLSKSMIQNHCKNKKVYPSTQTTSSMIDFSKQNNKKYTKPQQKKSEKMPHNSKNQTQVSQILRKRIQNISKKFYLNYVKSQRKIKTHKNKNIQNESPKKFQPFALNKSFNFFLQEDVNKTPSSKINSNEKFKKRVKTEGFENQTNQTDPQKYWGYLPIMVVTGFGLYHGIRAVLGK